jgi:Chromosome segregation ATPases
MAQSIQTIREKRDEIREKIKALNLKNYENQRFGVESEYTYKGLIGEVESLLTDLSTLTQYENKFIKLSNYRERKQIAEILINISSYLESPTNLYSYIEDLKIILRTYNIRNFSENLIQFEEEIDDVKRTRVELEEVLAISSELEEKITEKSDEIVKLYDEAEEKLEGIQKKFRDIKDELESVSRKTEDAQSLNEELEEIKKTADSHLTDIIDFRTKSESNQKLIDNFATKIQDRDKRLTELEQKIIENDKALSKYEEERETLLKEAEDLIESAKTALNYKTAEGLSASFSEQYKNSNKTQISAGWIIGAIFCLLITLGLGIWFLHNISEDNKWYFIVGRLLLLPMPIIGAIFCANQYTKQKNITEDYAYKTVIAKSIVGFSEQLKKNSTDNSEYITYIAKALEEIHKDPLRAREHNSSKVKLDKTQFDKLIETLPKLLEFLNGKAN